ncbi:MAG: hypothetical protein Q9181_005248, partial [Wetmoreana brouardii]
PSPLPFDLGGFHWGDDITFNQSTGTMDYDTGFDKSSKVVGQEIIEKVLLQNCGYRPRNILLFGYGQGGMVAVAAALALKMEFGGIVSIGGPRPSNIPCPVDTGIKNQSPIIVLGGSSSTLITQPALTSLKDAFRHVEYVKWSKPGDGMPRNKDEMLPIMKFFARRLQSRSGVPEDAVEVGLRKSTSKRSQRNIAPVRHFIAKVVLYVKTLWGTAGLPPFYGCIRLEVDEIRLLVVGHSDLLLVRRKPPRHFFDPGHISIRAKTIIEACHIQRNWQDKHTLFRICISWTARRLQHLRSHYTRRSAYISSTHPVSSFSYSFPASVPPASHHKRPTGIMKHFVAGFENVLQEGHAMTVPIRTATATLALSGIVRSRSFPTDSIWIYLASPLYTPEDTICPIVTFSVANVYTGLLAPPSKPPLIFRTTAVIMTFRTLSSRLLSFLLPLLFLPQIMAQVIAPALSPYNTEQMDNAADGSFWIVDRSDGDPDNSSPAKKNTTLAHTINTQACLDWYYWGGLQDTWEGTLCNDLGFFRGSYEYDNSRDCYEKCYGCLSQSILAGSMDAMCRDAHGYAAVNVRAGRTRTPEK